jgi:phosphate butyryltransferase
MPIRTFEQLKYEAVWAGPKRVAIAAAANAETLAAARQAQTLGLAQCILIDAGDKIMRLSRAHDIDTADMTVIDVDSHELAAKMAMHMAHAGDADVVMKGSLESALFLRAALDRENGLRTGKLLTHVGIFEVPGFGRLLLITDAGVIVAPDIYQKMEIVQNGIDVARKLGIETPKVAILAAAELVDPKIPSTVDAANLSKMAERGQIRGGIVDGPLALDNAISKDSAEVKGIRSEVAGEADVLVVPDIEAGNLLAKAIMYFAHSEMAGVVVGGCAPMVLTSRSDSLQTKLVSIALGILLSTSGCQAVRLG